jgi:hypothetical protein
MPNTINAAKAASRPLFDPLPATFVAEEALANKDLHRCRLSDFVVVAFLILVKEGKIKLRDVVNFETVFNERRKIRVLRVHEGQPALAPDGTVLAMDDGPYSGSTDLDEGPWTLENVKECPGYADWFKCLSQTASDLLTQGIHPRDINNPLPSQDELNKANAQEGTPAKKAKKSAKEAETMTEEHSSLIGEEGASDQDMPAKPDELTTLHALFPEEEEGNNSQERVSGVDTSANEGDHVQSAMMLDADVQGSVATATPHPKNAGAADMRLHTAKSLPATKTLSTPAQTMGESSEKTRKFQATARDNDKSQDGGSNEKARRKASTGLAREATWPQKHPSPAQGAANVGEPPIYSTRGSPMLPGLHAISRTATSKPMAFQGVGAAASGKITLGKERASLDNTHNTSESPLNTRLRAGSHSTTGDLPGHLERLHPFAVQPEERPLTLAEAHNGAFADLLMDNTIKAIDLFEEFIAHQVPTPRRGIALRTVLVMKLEKRIRKMQRQILRNEAISPSDGHVAVHQGHSSVGVEAKKAAISKKAAAAADVDAEGEEGQEVIPHGRKRKSLAGTGE